MYIGAVAVLPTCVNRILFCNSVRLMVDGCRLLEESKSGKQALREVGLITFCCCCVLFLTMSVGSLGRWRLG